MKKWLGMIAGTAVVLAAVAPTMGADLRTPVKAPVMPVVGCGSGQFQGFYVGGHASWVHYQANRTDPDGYLLASGATTNVAKDSGFGAGVQAGYNWQCRGKLLGIEADWTWTDTQTETRRRPDLALFFPGTDQRINSDLKWFGTIRTRAGIVIDDILLYVTGGVAYADITTTYRNVATFGTPLNESLSFSDRRWGWTAGVGAEWALWSNWSLKSEVLYLDFTDRNHRGFSPGFAGPFHFTHSDSILVSRIGLNFRWGGGPVVAAY